MYTFSYPVMVGITILENLPFEKSFFQINMNFLLTNAYMHVFRIYMQVFVY